MRHSYKARNSPRTTMTKTVSISKVRGRLGHFVEKVGKTSASYVITKKGSTGAVLMSHEEYESWKATLEIISNREDLAAIEKGVADLNAGKGRSFEDVFGEPLNDSDHQIRSISTRRS